MNLRTYCTWTVPFIMIVGLMLGLFSMTSLAYSFSQPVGVPIFSSASTTKPAQVIPDLKLVPGGHSIGVRMKSSGVMVIGFHQVQQSEQVQVSPAEDAKLSIGDLITHINGKPIRCVQDLSESIASFRSTEQSLQVTVQRNQEELQLSVKPIYDIQQKTYQMGLYIRDSANGVGTLTFYAPEQHVYGALGHVITDADTKIPIVVGEGEIVESQVTSIAKSEHGEPGEKRALFFKDSDVLGNIEKNTPFGIFGKMNQTPAHSYRPERVPVALREEVQKGPAHVYTVIDGQQVQKFDIEIVQTHTQDQPATKGMVIKITDPKLLAKTGGIIQGMSGSPILQNGKLVGAVTHVFVNDPASGYGCYMEWMLEDAGIRLRAEQKPLAS
jgi:stage IV sporulation protein B